MGEMADLDADWADFVDDDWDRYDYGLDQNPPVWTMADGTMVKITEMTDRHLHNTIKYLRRKDRGGDNRGWIEALEFEVDRRLGRNYFITDAEIETIVQAARKEFDRADPRDHEMLRRINVRGLVQDLVNRALKSVEK